jgi:hypothetical protein
MVDRCEGEWIIVQRWQNQRVSKRHQQRQTISDTEANMSGHVDRDHGMPSRPARH